jgi:hypothetical protein
MKRRSMVITALLLALSVTSSLAYVLSDGRWRDGVAVVYVGMSGTAPNGRPWKEALISAMQQWNATPFRFVVDERYADPCSGYTRSSTSQGFPAGNGDRRNGIDFRADVCGNEFGAGVLAITLNLGTATNLGFNHIVEADIVFNSAVNWSIYDGPRRSQVDFGRVALHELGHVLGLNHEPAERAIMAPNIGDLDALTTDDIAGATRLYGGSIPCPITRVELNRYIRGTLQTGDCRVQQLYGNGNDTSFVDTYRLDLTQQRTLRLRMASNMLDSVLLITDLQLKPIELFDDTNGSCDVDVQVTLPAGSYLLLANTYVKPEKCAGNTGNYHLQISDSGYPLLGNTVNARSGGTLVNALFSGQARPEGPSQSRTRFAATDRIVVEGRIDADPAHVGQPASLYVLAILSNGGQFMQNAQGQFVPFTGLAGIQAAGRRVLRESETLRVVDGLQGSSSGLAGLGFQVFLGYALDSAPQDIHHGGKAITFSIDR